jgi:hypothetical protein
MGHDRARQTGVTTKFTNSTFDEGVDLFEGGK